MGEGRNVYRVLVGKPEGKRPFGRPRRRWEDGIKMDLMETGWAPWSEFTRFRGLGPLAGCCEIRGVSSFRSKRTHTGALVGKAASNVEI
jgi:hypothetical protein